MQNSNKKGGSLEPPFLFVGIVSNLVTVFASPICEQEIG